MVMPVVGSVVPILVRPVADWSCELYGSCTETIVYCRVGGGGSVSPTRIRP